MRALQQEEKRYQIAKDLSDNLTVSYNTSEVVMARLLQTTNAKERVYSQAVSFFSTNEVVLTALTASFTGMFGLHEGTQTVEAMKEGVSKSLEVLADIGGKVQEAAVLRRLWPDHPRRFGQEAGGLGGQLADRPMRSSRRCARTDTRNANEIRDAVEDGKRKLARLAEEGKGLLEADLNPGQGKASHERGGGRDRQRAGGDPGAASGAATASRRWMTSCSPWTWWTRCGGASASSSSELDDTGREEDLKERLRKIYAAQGIEVPDRVIEQGVAALKEGRFTYKPPPDSFGTRLARLYISRGHGASGSAAWRRPSSLVGATGSLTLPDAALPKDLAQAHGGTAWRTMPAPAPRRMPPGRGQAALARRGPRRPGRHCGAWRTAPPCWSRSTACASSTGPGSVGVFRIPDINSTARNYYIVVEAVDGAGNAVKVPIKNEETRKTEGVTSGACGWTSTPTTPSSATSRTTASSSRTASGPSAAGA